MGILVQGKHDGQHVRQIRRGVQKDLALVQRLPHELVLLVIELHHRFLEVSYAAMDEFGRLGRRPYCVLDMCARA